MKNLIYVLCFIAILISSNTVAQITAPNNANVSGRYVGFDNTGTNDLPIRNDADADINIWRNNIQKFRISEHPLWNGLNGLQESNAQRTTLGLNGESYDAWSMLHLWSGLTSSIYDNLQRNWFNVGTSYTANKDFMYCGLMERPISDDPDYEIQTDAILAWGCQPGNEGHEDNFRILFLQPPSYSQGPAASNQGLETLRITPLGNVGIGDFSTMPTALNCNNFSYGAPQARLDVQYFGERPEGNIDAAVNIRNIALHDGSVSEPRYGLRVVSENFHDETLIPNFGGHFTANGFRQPVGVYGTVIRDFLTGWAVGVKGESVDPTGESVGVENFGVMGYAKNDDAGGRAFGIYGRTEPSNPDHWAGYFVGDTWCSNGVWTGSDENLKTDIQPIENAISIINQIETKTYHFTDNSELGLTSEGLNYGVLAQQLETVLPDLVRTVNSPGSIDESGQYVEGESFKAVRYQDLIPILIAGFNEQSQVIAAQDSLTKSKNDDIEELENKIQKLEEKLNSISGKMQKVKQDTDDCCNLKNQTQSGGSTEENSGNQLKLEQNVPNPFQERTRIDFEIPENAQVKLEITDKVGKVVEVLMEGNLQSGTYSTTWNGASYASGVYYYSLYANGQLLTKKMIKQ